MRNGCSQLLCSLLNMAARDSLEMGQQGLGAFSFSKISDEDYGEAGPQSFDPDEVKQQIEAAVISVVQHADFAPKRVHEWSSNIVEAVLKSLQQSNKPFKYIVTAIIMQKNGAGLHTASTCYWDTKTDGSCTFRWENATMHVIVTVFALHI